jgi:hypothetical protein
MAIPVPSFLEAALMSGNAGNPTTEPAAEVANDAPPTASSGKGWWSGVLDEFGFKALVSEYLIPVETNSVWYSLGGVLAVALVLEILTGFLLSLVYVPDASLAYGITVNFMQ